MANYFYINIDDNVLKLYEGLHLIHGENDDSKYKLAVCNYYQNKIEEVVKSTNILSYIIIDFTIKEIDEIKKGLQNLDKFILFYTLLKESYNNNVDLTKLNIKIFKKNINFNSDEMDKWLEKALFEIDNLPKERNYSNLSFIEDPFKIFFRYEKFKLSDQAIEKIKKITRYFNSAKDGNLVIDSEDDITDYEKTKSGKLSQYEKYCSYIDNNNYIGLNFDDIAIIIAILENDEKYNNIKDKKIDYFLTKYVAYTNNHRNCILTKDVIHNEILVYIKETLEEIKNDNNKQKRKRNISLLVGFVFWIILTITILFLLYHFEICPFKFYVKEKMDNFWMNILLYLKAIGITILLLFLSLFSIAYEHIYTENRKVSYFKPNDIYRVSDFFFKIPKGLLIFLSIYYVFFDKHLYLVSDYSMVWNIIGIIWIIACCYGELNYFYKSERFIKTNGFMTIFFSQKRGMILFSNVTLIFTILPIIFMPYIILNFLPIKNFNSSQEEFNALLIICSELLK